jgi:hypothetical protein
MTKRTEEAEQPEALATFAATARNKGTKPVDPGALATAPGPQSGCVEKFPVAAASSD